MAYCVEGFLEVKKDSDYILFSLRSWAILVVSLVMLCRVEQPLRNPYWFSYSKLLISRWLTRELATIFYSIFEIALRRDIGL